MKTTLCTLYNSLYLDKGLVLYDSLKECAKDFELYVLCMDEKCYEVLSDINEKKLKPILLKEIEDEEMLKAKSNRSLAEYCWTCSSRLIRYIFETYRPAYCTYIDADMYFYHDPQLLVDEMIKANKSVMITPHRFDAKNKNLEKKVGTFCVEFNTFKNDEAGNKVLNYWHQKCIECCATLNDGVHWGDQKYLEKFPLLFEKNVHICQHKGAGIAPWNMEDYRSYDDEQRCITYNLTGLSHEIIFYHFQGIKYISREMVEIGFKRNQKGLDYNSIYTLYQHYLREIDEKKNFLIDAYSINLLVKKHPSKTFDFKSILKSIDFVNKILLYIPFYQSAYKIKIVK